MWVLQQALLRRVTRIMVRTPVNQADQHLAVISPCRTPRSYRPAVSVTRQASVRTAPSASTVLLVNTTAPRRVTGAKDSSVDQCARTTSTHVDFSATASSTKTNVTSVAIVGWRSVFELECAKKVYITCISVLCAYNRVPEPVFDFLTYLCKFAAFGVMWSVIISIARSSLMRCMVTIPLRFDCDLTALHPFDDLHNDRTAL